MDNLSSYLAQLPNTIDIWDFLLNMAVTAILCWILSRFYIGFAGTVGNRKRFAANFLPLGLTTAMIITIIHFSPLLSLGLVGALSIVRYRAAIKEPEELTYLFWVIGTGLAAGANQPLVAVLAVGIMMGLIYGLARIHDVKSKSLPRYYYLNLQTESMKLNEIVDQLNPHFRQINLKRLDQQGEQLALRFLVEVDSIAKLEAARTQLNKLSPNSNFSLVDKPEILS